MNHGPPEIDQKKHRLICARPDCPQQDFCMLAAFPEWLDAGIAPEGPECEADALFSAWLEGQWIVCSLADIRRFSNHTDALNWVSLHSPVADTE